MKKVIQIGDKILEEKSSEVRKIKSDDIQNLIKDLLEVCEIKEETTGGLSAPQIGVNKRVLIVRRLDIEEEYARNEEEIPSELEMWLTMINPKIIAKDNDKQINWEGCLSVNEGELFGPVERSRSIKVEYKDRKGKTQTISAEGYFASAILHEIDHLNGILFVRYIQDPEKLWTGKDLDNYISKHGEFPLLT